MVPAELSEKMTVKGARPMVGLALKPATGIRAPVPASGLVLLPALPARNTTALLKRTALGGVKRTTTSVEPNPSRVKVVPEARSNPGPPGLRRAALPLKAAPPRLLR